MQSDAYTRIMLSLIAALLAVIAAQHFAGKPGEPADPASGADPGRYQITNTRIGRALTAIRIDQATGDVWRLQVEEGELYWDPIREDGELPPAGEAGAAESGAEAARPGAKGAAAPNAGAKQGGAAGAGAKNAGKAPTPTPPQQGP